MARPYLCHDVAKRWAWMGGQSRDLLAVTNDVERECREAWADADDRYWYEDGLIRGFEFHWSPTLRDGYKIQWNWAAIFGREHA